MFLVKDKREKMANQLLMRGYATMRELLTASFGEWPPKGLDVDENIPHEQIVQIHKTMSFKTLGSAYPHKRQIDISKFYFKYLPKILTPEGVRSTLGHEAVHILQYDHYIRPNEIFKNGTVKKVSSKPLSRDDSSWDRGSMSRFNSMQELLFYDSYEGKAKGRASMIFNRKARKKSDFYYMKSDMEMQSHLHEILIAGYPEWGRLPSNKDEFLAALSSARLGVHNDIKKYLDSLPQDSSVRDFLKVKMKTSLASGRISSFVKLLSSDSTRKMFWKKVLPMVYSDLIEMYGDKQGRARFNLGVNKRADLYRKVSSKKNAEEKNKPIFPQA